MTTTTRPPRPPLMLGNTGAASATVPLLPRTTRTSRRRGVEAGSGTSPPASLVLAPPLSALRSTRTAKRVRNERKDPARGAEARAGARVGTGAGVETSTIPEKGNRGTEIWNGEIVIGNGTALGGLGIANADVCIPLPAGSIEKGFLN